MSERRGMGFAPAPWEYGTSARPRGQWMQAQKAVAANPAPTAVERAVRIVVPPLMFLAAFLVVMSHAFVPAEEFIHRGDDAYYYFKVAANFPDAGRWTFDTIHSTNGVQPLWAIILTSLAQLLSWF